MKKELNEIKKLLMVETSSSITPISLGKVIDAKKKKVSTYNFFKYEILGY